jgi:hypothetical protein
MVALRTPVILLALFLAAWLPRTIGLDRFVTVDERKWLTRAANFYQALSQGEWSQTFQREHPGVTVMWAGTAALLQHYPAYAQEAPGQFTWEEENLEDWLVQQTTLTPLALLTAGRRWIVLIISLAIAVGYLPLRKVLGAPLAALATLFIAWDPFAIALSQQLHPDGFVAALTALALLLWLAWRYGGHQRRYLLASGVVMGLAWLTKTPAIFLALTGVLLWIGDFGFWKRRTAVRLYKIQNPQSEIQNLLLWGCVATLTFVLLWPAMWVDPLGTLRLMATEMSEYVERHTTVNYFWGQPVADPGPLFYPVALLFRASPALLIGLIAALVAGWRQKGPFAEPVVRQVAFGLLLFTFVLTVGMTLGAKKFDRYLLPAFPALNVLAALGWVGVIRRVVGTHGRASLLVTCLVFFLHALPGLLHYPYYLTYFNPLVGGTRTAPAVLFVGWGEGLDAAARWLNAQPNAAQARVVTWYADGPVSYFFDGQAVEVGYGSPLSWLDTDYAVVYVNQWQRHLPSPEAIDYFLAQTPVHTIRSGGLDLAYVYDLRNTLLPDFLDIGKAQAADFGGQIRLSAYTIPQSNLQPGDELAVTLYLQSLVPMTTNYNIGLRLTRQDGTELWRADGWPWGAPTVGWPVREIRPDGHTITIPAEAEAGLYKLTATFYDPATLEPLPVTAVQGEGVIDPAVRDIAVLAVDPPLPQQVFDPPWHIDRFFHLTGATLPAQLRAGETLPLTLAWQSIARSDVAYTVFVHVVDATGVTVAQHDQPPSAGFAPTPLWQPGLRLLDEYAIALPADLPAGQYTILVGLYTAAGGRLPVAHGEHPAGDAAPISTFTVE